MNTDIRVDVGFLDHWKTDTLIAACGADGVLALMRLWTFAAQNKPDGRLTGVQTSMIERIAKWRGDPGALLRVLIETRFIEQDQDGVWLIHDWEQHNPYAASAEFRRDRARKANAIRRGKYDEDCNSSATSTLRARYEHPSSTPQSRYEHATSTLVQATSAPVAEPEHATAEPEHATSAPLPSPSPSPSPFPFFPAADSEPAPLTTTDEPKKEKKGGGEAIIPNDYTPKPDTLAIIQTAFGIPADFIVRQIPLFILHHQEAGSRKHGFESLFVGWVRKAWNAKPPAAQELACAASGRRKGQTHIEKLMEDHVRLFGQHPAPDPFATTPTTVLLEGSIEHVH